MATGPSARKSSLFEIQKSNPIDSGTSSISLSDVPSISKRGSRVQYENTFKMEPDHHCEISQVKPIINRILEEIFSSAAYDPLECGVLCKNASTAIKDATKQLRTDRYKYVVTVTCSQNIGQGLKEASRFLWDSQRDNWVDGAFVSPTIQAQAVLYALYYE